MMRVLLVIALVFSALLLGCSSSSGFVVAASDDDTGAELEAGDTMAPLEAAGDTGGELEAAPLEADTAPPLEAGGDTAAPLEVDAAPACSAVAPGCCPSSLAGDLAACEAAAGTSAPKGWTWTRTANTAFRCSPVVIPPSPQPCEKSYRLAGGAVFCCVVGS